MDGRSADVSVLRARRAGIVDGRPFESARADQPRIQGPGVPAPLAGRIRRRDDVQRSRGRGRQVLVAIAGISIGELVDRAELFVHVVAGAAGLERVVTVPRIQKPGLALTGWPEQLHSGGVRVLHGTEIDYLARHESARTVGIATLFASEPA